MKRDRTLRFVAVFWFCLFVPSFLVSLGATSISEALDNTNLIWTTKGESAWSGQTDIYNFDGDSARSGVVNGYPQSSVLSTTIIGPGLLSFDWTVFPAYGFLRIYVNDIIRTNFPTGDWQRIALDLQTGTNKIEWRLSDNSNTVGFVDHVIYASGPVLPTIILAPSNIVESTEGCIRLSAAPFGTRPFNYHWQHNGTNISYGEQSFFDPPGQSLFYLTISNIRESDGGNYRLLVANSVGTNFSSETAVNVIAAPSLAMSLNTPSWIWRNDCYSASWHGQTNISHDGISSAESGATFKDFSNNANASLSTVIVGPGILKFWWKMTGLHYRSDKVQFLIDSLPAVELIEEQPWEQQVIELKQGEQKLSWIHQNQSVDSNQVARAWLDQIEFIPGGIAPHDIVGPINTDATLGRLVKLSASLVSRN